MWAEQTFRLFIILTTVISRRRKSMIHSFTVTFGAKYLTGMVTSILPYETFGLIKNNFLHQSKKYNNFWGMWPSGHVGHVFINMLFISTEIFHDKLPPQILLVGTTANAALRRTSKIIKSCLPNCYGFTKRGHQTSLILQLFMVL
jgi:hypothetical protein